MTEPRKSTVYDFSDLRLHPDGTRVYQRSTNLRPKIARVVVQDARSNWIAADAGGSGKVPMFRKKTDVAEETAAPLDQGAEEGLQSGGEVDKKQRPGHRSVKRKKFLRNDDYLSAEPSSTKSESIDLPSLPLPDPSSDLLKCIHRFASEFYNERGQLLNSSRQYRKERKERRARKQRTDGSDVESSSSSSSAKSTKSLESRSQSSDDTDEESEDVTMQDKNSGPKTRRRKGRHRSEKLYIDMYKTFDGSALMALGMLVQEQIAHLLAPAVPDGWEAEVHSAYTDPWGDSQSSKGSKGGGPKQMVSSKQEQKGNQTSDEDMELGDDEESIRSDDSQHSSSSEAEYR